jgi:hypothetical protein
MMVVSTLDLFEAFHRVQCEQDTLKMHVCNFSQGMLNASTI